MKKRLSLLLIVMMCLFAAGCNSGNDSQSPSPDSEEAKQQAQEQNELLQAFSSGEFPTEMGSFTTTDLDGNEVTEACFADADVTIVHFWATYCDPCLEEMKNLGKMAESLPDNVQIIGIAADVGSADSEECKLAKQILSDNKVDFPSLCAQGEIQSFLSNIVGVPTTIAVDPEGNIVADPIVGSDVLGYKRMALDYLDSTGN